MALIDGPVGVRYADKVSAWPACVIMLILEQLYTLYSCSEKRDKYRRNVSAFYHLVRVLFNQIICVQFQQDIDAPTWCCYGGRVQRQRR